MVKVLHTSDWHLGARLYERPRLDEAEFFLKWLRDFIQEEEVNILLVAGDVYDSSLPPGEAVGLYYNFLSELFRENGERVRRGEFKVVIIGGNHDSPLRLEGPGEFLRLGGVEVFGRWGEGLTPPGPVRIRVGGERLSIHPFPYIAPHEALGKAPRWNEEEREEYAKVLSEAMERSVEEGEDVRICLSHLWVEGLQGGGSERSLEVGGLGQLPLSALPTCDYFALGHIHSPTSVSDRVHYSGTPYPLTFREAEVRRRVILWSPGEGAASVEVPLFRKLIRLEGSQQEIMERSWLEDLRGALLEVTVHLKGPEPGLNERIRKSLGKRGAEVLAVIPLFERRERRREMRSTLLKPLEVFELCWKEEHGAEPPREIRDLFLSLLREVGE